MATVSLQEMGERTITTQVRIDGDIAPEFDGWELEFNGERFILPVREPQSTKDNSTRNSLIDLTFYSWPVYQMKRSFFAEMTAINSNTAIADKYKASLFVNLSDFVDAFNDVLNYYFGGKIVMDLASYAPGAYNTDPVFVEIDYSYIWDVLTKIYELYSARWFIVYDSVNDVYTIKVGYLQTGIDDHDFEYGYQGGLLKFERQLQDDNIVNILLGRGGEKNLPYRYFKDTDPGNPDWTADPDAIPELASIYFDRLRDVNFRWYVRGWMQNSHRDHSWDATHTFPTYTLSSSSPYYYAYQRGMTDERFNPVEFVKDDDSILKYGERWGALEDNDDIYPTIQGIEVDPYGRIDETVDISQIVTDDMDAYSSNSSVEMTLADVSVSLKFSFQTAHTLLSDSFVIKQGDTGNVTYSVFSKELSSPNLVYVDTLNTTVVAVDESGTEYPISGLPAGTYRLKVNLAIHLESPAVFSNGTFGICNIVVKTSNGSAEGWKPTFDIWVKNLWGTTQNNGESDEDYSLRVWQKILGDRVGGEAKIVFSTGPMAASEDYEFTIASYPMPDNSKTIVTYVNGVLTTVPSHWRITLYKCDAEFDATGLYIPNSKSTQPAAGDHFFFTGIDMPFQYVVWAEERLNAYKQDNLDDTAEVNPTWVISIDKVRCNTLEGEEYGSTLAERLATGATVRIKDPRFTGGDVLILYVQSIKYTWNEPSKGKPYLVPDIEVVLSDRVVSTVSTVGKMQSQINHISSSYVRAEDVESAIRQVAGALFLKKTGEEDKSASPTRFANKVTSANFRPGGVSGRGWGLYEDNADSYNVGTVMSPSQTRRRAATRDVSSDADEGQGNKAVFEIDKLIVRDEMQVNSLVVNQISYQGGKEIISAAEIEVTMVVETADTYDCYFDQKQNSVENLFVVNDIAYGQVWEPDNTDLRYYKSLVTAVGLNYISLSKTVKDGQGVPQKGDVIVQYGNTTNTSRQYVIVRDVIGGGYERMLSGLDAVDATGNEYYFAGRVNGDTDRWFVGDLLGEYAEWHDGELNIKGRFSVRKSDGTYIAMNQYIADNSYLTDALLNGATIIDGGLVLSSMIQLGKTEQVSGEDQFVVYSGMNGAMDATARGGGIAAWYGGPMVDHEESQSANPYAKSLFRFDGSGYLASGNIAWNASGNGHIPGITWTGNDIIISGNVKLQSTTGDSVTDLINAVQQLSSLFEVLTINGQSTVHVKSGRAFYSDSWVSGGGVGSAGGGGGTTVSFLSDLTDVDAPTPSNGDLLVWDTNHRDSNNNIVPAWVNVRQNSIVPSIAFSDLTSHPNTLSGYGINDAYTKSEVDSAISAMNVLDSVSTDPQENGVLVFTWHNGDVVRADLNHAHSNYVPITRTINGHSLNADVTLSATADLGVAEWAIGGTGSKVPFDRLPNMYIGRTQVSDSAANRILVGINGITTAASDSASNDATLIKYENGAWHFKGNILADGWIAAGGTGSGSVSVSYLNDIGDVTAPSPNTHDFLYWNGSAWVNTPIKTINGTNIFGSGNISISGGGSSYTLPAASTSALGGIKVGAVLATTPSINAVSDTAGKYYYVECDANGLAFVNVPWVAGSGGGGGLGEVGLTMPNCFSVSNSPLTSDGTITVAFANQTKNYVLAAPSTQNGVPSFRALVEADIPDVFVTKAGAQNITGTKTFTVNQNFSADIKASTSSHIDLGPIRLQYDSTNDALRITTNDSTSHPTISLYADGFVAAGGVGSIGSASVAYLNDIGDVTAPSPDTHDFLYWDGTAWVNTPLKTINGNAIFGSGNISISGGGGGAGTLTSVGLTMPNCFSVANSPLTSDGSIAVSFTSQTQNYVLAAPATANGTPAFRALAASDIPDISGTYVTKAGAQDVTGTKTFTVEQNFKAGLKLYNSSNLSGQIVAPGYMVFRAGTAIDLSDSSTYKQLTFTSSGFYPESPINLGYNNSNGRWSNIYAVNEDLTGDLKLASTSHIDLGPVRFVYDSTNNALRITTNDSTNHPNIGLYADSFVAAGGVGPSSQYLKYVTCSTVSEYNSLTKDATTMYIVGNPVIKVYLGTVQLYSAS